MPHLQPTVPETPNRKRLHTRNISLEGYKRDDGLWDIEARLTDRKDHDYVLVSGVRLKGEAVHEMWVRVTIDGQFNILAAHADFQAMPYAGCSAIAPDYGRMVGLNLLRGFRRQVAEMFGNTKGCAHVTELLSSLPTAAIQSFASEMDDRGAGGGEKPPHLDRCHALDTSGEAVKRFYPRWYRSSDSGGQAASDIPSPSNLQRARKKHENS